MKENNYICKRKEIKTEYYDIFCIYSMVVAQLRIVNSRESSLRVDRG